MRCSARGCKRPAADDLVICAEHAKKIRQLYHNGMSSAALQRSFILPPGVVNRVIREATRAR